MCRVGLVAFPPTHPPLPFPLDAQVTVPGAHIEEMLPAARLLEQATTGVAPADYAAAKAAFLQGLKGSSRAAQVRRQALRLGRLPCGCASFVRVHMWLFIGLTRMTVYGASHMWLLMWPQTSGCSCS